MRTLTGVSRLFLLAAISVAALLVFGGAYFIGYVGQFERGLSDPESASQRTAAQIAIVEHALGHAGFLKNYRDYWAGDAQAQADLGKRTAEAAVAYKAIEELTADQPSSAATVREIGAVVDIFARTAAEAPATPPSGLRGVTDDSVRSLPSAGQLETTYLTLATSFERLREAERASQVRNLGGLLDRAQMLIGITLAALIAGLLAVAWVMRFGVIQPLNILERSLAAAAKGVVGPRIWGTDRHDEIGELALAGEAMRRALADMPALKTLADKGQIHVTLEGPGSMLFEKLAAHVAGAVAELKAAAGDADQVGAARRTGLNVAIAQLGRACNDIQSAATSLRDDFGQMVETVRVSSQTLLSAATEGASEVGKIAGRFENGSEELAAVAARASERVAAVLSDLTNTAQGLRQASDHAKQGQAAFLAAHGHFADDAARTNEAVRGIGARLGGLLGGTEEHLAHVLGTLDRLEKGLDQTVAGLQSRTVETMQALSRATSIFDERTATTEKNLAAIMSEFALASKALGSDSEGAADQVHDEISHSLEHVDEERLPPAHRGGEPLVLLEGPAGSREGTRTLAEVPKAEVLERLGDLAAEMQAATANAANTEEIKSALACLADELRQLGNAPETRRTSDELSATLTRHANTIDVRAAQSTPTPEGLRDELSTMARELRQVSAHTKNGTGAGAAARVAQAADDIEERARRLFAQLEDAHVSDEDAELSLETASADVEALARLAAKLEARAEALSEQAVASRFDEASDKASPTELSESALAADLRTDSAIQTVFEAIERLNNVAAALARAGDAERQRRLAN